MDAADPRLLWLLSQAPRWRDAREKTLVFVAHRETLEMLRTALSQRAQLATGVFHEELSAGAPRHRGRPVPRTRWSEPARVHRMRRRGPQLRVLPPPRAVRPALEAVARRTAHRPARSDRPAHTGGDRVLPAAGRNRRGRRAALRGAGPLPRTARRAGAAAGPRRGRARGDRARSSRVALRRALRRRWSSEAHAARTRIREAAYQQLHRDPYRSEMAAGILARVPAELDALNEEVVVTACIGLGFTRRAPARTAGLRDRARQRGAGRQSARRPRRIELRRLVRPRGGRRERDDRLLRLRASARGGDLCPLRRAAPWAASRGSKSRSARNAARAWSPSTRTGPRSRSWRSTASGRARPDWAAAFHERSLRVRGVTTTQETATGQAWFAASAHSSTRPVVRTRSPLSWCDRRTRPWPVEGVGADPLPRLVRPRDGSLHRG